MAKSIAKLDGWHGRILPLDTPLYRPTYSRYSVCDHITRKYMYVGYVHSMLNRIQCCTGL